ncbi:hypothetical protein E2C01_023168 [Portunus trituberculatus]|uniref:Uncharacterized protein n=1 Tax=Portunus trituberculatus TaxID=210409 RepID=A0A5B7E9N9_PORTR|nr:hypothetical protein [Portunus trituberculatus]
MRSGGTARDSGRWESEGGSAVTGRRWGRGEHRKAGVVGTRKEEDKRHEAGKAWRELLVEAMQRLTKNWGDGSRDGWD